MTSIIRLKRQRDEDPIESLMVACKKFKDDEHLQKTCQLTFAGTAKSENECVRVVRRALQMDILDKCYASSAMAKQPVEVSKRGTKRARPADDLEIVSSVGAQNLGHLFQSKRARLQSDNSEESKFRLVDVVKKSKDLQSDCVFDIFYTTDPNVAGGCVDAINFFLDGEDICESEDEEGKEVVNQDMNYFEDDVEEENYWTKDYPDEFNVFYEDDEDGEDDDDDSDDGDDESRFVKEVEDMYSDNDYGDYIHHFVGTLSKLSLNVKKTKSQPKKKAALQGSLIMDWD